MHDITASSSQKLIPPSALFRFEIPCWQIDNVWEPNGPCELPEKYRVPSFAALDDRQSFADVRLGWSKRGIALSLTVQGKTALPWCRANRLDASDGLILWLSTRETDNIHRANRFCHQYAILPCGRGPRLDQPVIEPMVVQRAIEHPKPLPAGALQVRSERRKDGYALRAAIPALALTGFDPNEHRRMGFSYAVMDQEIGPQLMTLGKDYPVESDPTLWGSLALQGNS